MAGGSGGRIANEQATLRRVAMLVGRAAPPEEVFAAVAAEAGRLLDVEYSFLSRYDPDGAATVVGAWSRTGPVKPLPVGTRIEPGGTSVHHFVFQSGRPARIDDYGDDPGQVAQMARQWGVHSVVGVPITLEGRLWGVIGVVSADEQLLPADTETWLAGFTELVATAIANAQARVELRRYAEEQAALRRVAELVARATPPEELFTAVAAEAGRLVDGDLTVMNRYDPDGAVTIVAIWTRTSVRLPLPVGGRTRLGGRNVTSLVFETGRPARIDDYDDASGPIADAARAGEVRAAVGVPITVEGRLWGNLLTVSNGEEPLPADTEDRLAGFTELVATAIANAQARVELRGYAEEQAALRRMATLVARAAPPEEVFAAVCAEAGRLLEVDYTILGRYDLEGAVDVIGGWARSDPGRPLAVGIRMEPGGRNVHNLVFRSGRPARIDDYGDTSGAAADVARDWGLRSAVGAPISVQGRLWGVITAASTHEEPLPADIEGRLTGFTELVGTALANADAQAALTASRARIVAAADTARSRIERDLHDGAQQRLVSLALRVRGALADVPPADGELAAQLEGVADGLISALEDLREIARGLHPAGLDQGGLSSALRSLARRSAVPVLLDVRVDGRLPEQIELAAYYVVAEALTNAARHAGATVIDVEVAVDDGALRVGVQDDGSGGADLSLGSGLVGLVDRVETLGGRLSLNSPPDGGTRLEIALPLDG